MSKRHNRKRTRSRPRNRLGSGSSGSSSSFSYQTLSYQPSGPTIHSSSNTHPSASHWAQQYALWQARQQFATTTSQRSSLVQSAPLSTMPHHSKVQASLDDAQRMRFFGGSADDLDDDESLCAPMLQVVLDLFNGRIDYEDP